MRFREIFRGAKPVLACIHLLPLPGAPLYGGSMGAVYERALEEAAIFERNGIDGLIVENFRDKPFFPAKIPAETLAALTAVTTEVVRRVKVPVGVNALRNDAGAALAAATAAEAHFIRVNVHMGAVV